ncbi:HAD family hydrolase [Ornithinimicrobium panacihumi]|uniref:HAD family hydrolase n=1 Tax=Ornithinimicrobium panacihumi TaxID=2008449 RepID=UPI003F8C9CF9
MTPTPMSPQLPAAVLWDMDGTIIDTEPYWMAAETDLVESFGGTWTHEQGLQLVGNPLVVSAEIILAQTPVTGTPEEIVDLIQGRVRARMAEQMPWRPGALELLTGLKERGVPCALVTMSCTVLAEVLQEALPEGTFDAVITGDVVAHGKPHPEPYLTAAAHLGVDPEDCVALEDSPTGTASAVAAGVPTIGIPHMVSIDARPGLRLVDSLKGVGPEDLWGLATART